MTLTAIGGGHYLRSDAAASLERAFTDGAPRGQIYSSTRSWAEQQVLFEKYGYPRAYPPDKSDHVKGTAIDCLPPLERWFRARPQYGFVPSVGETGEIDSWHLGYFPEKDTRKNEEDDDMTPEQSRKLDEIHTRVMRYDDAKASEILATVKAIKVRTDSYLDAKVSEVLKLVRNIIARLS